MNISEIKEFYKGKKVLVTGNTGFKGAWLTHILLSFGAEVIGYSLKSPTEPSLFKLAGMDSEEALHQVYADIRDLETLIKSFKEFEPEIVLHLAAQPIVRDSYKDPVNTYSTNVMGTVNVCEAVRRTESVRSFLNVTTDKVYKNREWEYGYRECDELDGYDPYSNSKSCSELVTHSYKNSFFTDGRVAISTARAGNVIGGGDFSNDRIIPDCVRAISADGVINVRNPYSTRPYQHVLEPLFAYMMIAAVQYNDNRYAGYYNVGPDDCDCVNTGNLVSMFCDSWNGCGTEKKIEWVNKSEENAPHEANFLRLECSKIKSAFGWKPVWHISEAIDETVKWTQVWLDDGNPQTIRTEMDREISVYGSGRE